MLRKSYILLLCFQFLMIISAVAKPIDLKDNKIEYWVKNEYVQIFIDSTNTLKFENLQNQFFFNYTGDLHSISDKYSYWIRFEIANPHSQQKSYKLEVYDFDIDKISFFSKNEHGEYFEQTAGFSLPFSLRTIQHKNISFPIRFYGQQENVCYMKFNSKKGKLLVPVIKNYEDSFAYAIKEYLFLGIFYGLFIFMISYYLVYFLILRKREYLLYVFYSLGLLVFLLSTNGIGFQLLWPNSPSWNGYTHIIGLFVSVLSLTFFVIDFLNLKNTAHTLYTFFLVVLTIRCMIFLIELFAPKTCQEFPLDIFDVLLAQLILYACYTRYQKGFKNIKWVLLSFIALDAAFFMSFMENKDWIESNFITVYSLNIGMVLQFILMTVGVAESVNITYQQNAKVQQDIIELTENANNNLEKQVAERTLELSNKNEQITASVRYAENIQRAILPPLDLLDAKLKDYFLYYKPKNIVSGDFYWFHEINESQSLVVLADCTGHGVPGAFMSIIGINILNTIVREKTTNPSEILMQLHLEIQKVLRQKETQNQDGMDLSLCLIDKKEHTLSYAGAKSCIYLISESEITKIKSSKKSIGGIDNSKISSYETVTFPIRNNTKIFFYSDGLIDQFGGANNQKFSSKQLMNILTNNKSKTAKDIGGIVLHSLEDWMHPSDFQIDDITFWVIEV